MMPLFLFSFLLFHVLRFIDFLFFHYLLHFAATPLSIRPMPPVSLSRHFLQHIRASHYCSFFFRQLRRFRSLDA